MYGIACQCVSAKCLKGTHNDAGASVFPHVHKFDLQNYSTDFEEICSNLVLILFYMRGEEMRQSGAKGKRDCGSVFVLTYSESMCCTRPKYVGRWKSRKDIPLVRKRQMFFAQVVVADPCCLAR
jgi:hypothetical protein